MMGQLCFVRRCEWDTIFRADYSNSVGLLCRNMALINIYVPNVGFHKF